MSLISSLEIKMELSLVFWGTLEPRCPLEFGESTGTSAAGQRWKGIYEHGYELVGDALDLNLLECKGAEGANISNPIGYGGGLHMLGWAYLVGLKTLN